MHSRGSLFSESMGWHLRRCSLQQNLNSLQSDSCALACTCSRKATSFAEASYDFLFLQSNLALPQALQAHWILTLLWIILFGPFVPSDLVINATAWAKWGCWMQSPMVMLDIIRHAMRRTLTDFTQIVKLDMSRYGTAHCQSETHELHKSCEAELCRAMRRTQWLTTHWAQDSTQQTNATSNGKHKTT